MAESQSQADVIGECGFARIKDAERCERCASQPKENFIITEDCSGMETMISVTQVRIPLGIISNIPTTLMTLIM